MMTQKPSDTKEQLRRRLEADVERWMRDGNAPEFVDHTANATWRARNVQDPRYVLDQVLAPSKNMGGNSGYELLRRNRTIVRGRK